MFDWTHTQVLPPNVQFYSNTHSTKHSLDIYSLLSVCHIVLGLYIYPSDMLHIQHPMQCNAHLTSVGILYSLYYDAQSNGWKRVTFFPFHTPSIQSLNFIYTVLTLDWIATYTYSLYVPYPAVNDSQQHPEITCLTRFFLCGGKVFTYISQHQSER